jgi:hypothetical protein
VRLSFPLDVRPPSVEVSAARPRSNRSRIVAGRTSSTSPWHVEIRRRCQFERLDVRRGPDMRRRGGIAFQKLQPLHNKRPQPAATHAYLLSVLSLPQPRRPQTATRDFVNRHKQMTYHNVKHRGGGPCCMREAMDARKEQAAVYRIVGRCGRDYICVSIECLGGLRTKTVIRLAAQ